MTEVDVKWETPADRIATIMREALIKVVLDEYHQCDIGKHDWSSKQAKIIKQAQCKRLKEIPDDVLVDWVGKFNRELPKPTWWAQAMDEAYEAHGNGGESEARMMAEHTNML